MQQGKQRDAYFDQFRREAQGRASGRSKSASDGGSAATADVTTASPSTAATAPAAASPVAETLVFTPTREA